MLRYTSWWFFPPHTSCGCMRWGCTVSSELTQKHLSCLEITGMVEENKEFSHSVLCFGNVSSGSVYLVRTVNTKASAHVILFLFMCQVAQTPLSESAGFEESSSSLPVSFLVSCWIHAQCRCPRSWRKEERCLLLRNGKCIAIAHASLILQLCLNT